MRRVWSVLIALASIALGQSTDKFGGTFESLKPPQKALLQEFARRFERTMGKKLDIAKVYNETRLSDRTTFEAVTHALMATRMTDAGGKSLGTAINLVDTIDSVAGEVPGARGDRQFRLYVYLKPTAFETLARAREFVRERENTVYHKGYPQCFRLKGAPPNIQISISRDNRRADIDVDYRSSKFPNSIVNGHLTASNSDVRAGNNDERHNGRWSGFAGWWRNLFSVGQTGEKDAREVVQPRVTGKSPLDEAVHDFLASWLVEKNPALAAAYFSRQVDPCIEAEALRQGRKVEGGMARFVAISSLRKASQEAGKVTRIDEVARAVEMSDAQVRPAKNRYPTEFTLVEVANHVGETAVCGEPRSTAPAPAKVSFGSYYASAFRMYTGQRPGSIVYFLWTKLDDQWKVVAFRMAEELAPALAPQQAASAAEDKPKPTVAGDPGAVAAIRNWTRAWVVDRDIPKTMAAFAPQSYACVANADPDQRGKTGPQLEAALKKGLTEAVQALPKGRTARQNIEAVIPVEDTFPVVTHADAEEVAIIRIPDQMSAGLTCGGKKSPPRPANPTYDANIYASLFRLKVGGEPAAFYCLWQRVGQAWKITAWRVETP